MAYILRHWRGELSLANSFWTNVFLLNFCIRGIEIWLTESSSIESPVLASQITISYLLLAVAVVYPWQMVGLWRSASRTLKETEKKFWAGAAKVLVVVGIFATCGNITGSWPAYKDLYKIGFTNHGDGKFQVDYIGNSLIHLQGELEFGISKEVRRLIADHPNVKGIVLDSIGGRVHEGRELSNIILTNQLDTYSLTHCYSACGLAFVSGNRRYLANGANLAFHQYTSGVESGDHDADLSSEQEKDLVVYKNRGISRDFIDKIFSAESNDFWYPTISEMLQSGVVHEIVDASTFKTIDYGYFQISELDDVLESFSAFKTIKDNDNELYYRFLNEMNEGMKSGKSILEMKQKLIGYMQSMASSSLPRSSDDSVTAFIQEVINTLQTLNKQDPILCIKNLFPDEYGSLEVGRHLMDYEMIPLLDAINMVIIDGYNNKYSAKIDSDSAEELIYGVLLELGDDAEYLEPKGLINNADYSKSCNSVSRFYGLILKNDKKDAGNALRYAFSL